MAEPFAQDYFLPRAFVQDEKKFLRKVGYIEVGVPQPNDVIGYAQTARELDFGELAFLLIAGAKFPIYRHWGIYIGDDMVESKFSVGHIYI